MPGPARPGCPATLAVTVYRVSSTAATLDWLVPLVTRDTMLVCRLDTTGPGETRLVNYQHGESGRVSVLCTGL